MATIKSYTDIEQSRKLAEILPLESADMFLAMNGTLPVMSKYIDNGLVTAAETAIPCWSLAALLDVLPILERKGYQRAKPKLLYNVAINKWIVNSHVYTTDAYDTPIDACVAMIEKLNELNLL